MPVLENFGDLAGKRGEKQVRLEKKGSGISEKAQGKRATRFWVPLPADLQAKSPAEAPFRGGKKK